MNRPLTPSLSPSEGERVAEGRVRGCSWLRCAILGIVETHEPGRLRVADPRSGPRLCEAQRFMVPMHAQKRMEALHELPIGARTAMSARIKSKELADKAVRAPVRRWFMVTMRGWKTVGTFHEPSRLRVADPRSGTAPL